MTVGLFEVGVAVFSFVAGWFGARAYRRHGDTLKSLIGFVSTVVALLAIVIQQFMLSHTRVPIELMARSEYVSKIEACLDQL